jgi:peptidoglycan/LPS O-acetylase OafA/YrhL
MSESAPEPKPVPLQRDRSPKHMRQLDSLRGFAVLAVILYHYFPHWFENSPLGWIGVRFFFVLSGFLITGILLRGREAVEAGKEGRWFMLRRFYTRRFLRIFPIYYLVLFILAICGAEEIRGSLLWHLSYLSNVRFVLEGYFQVWVAHFWTLSVEEQFYLLWPTMIVLMPRKFLVPALMLAVIIGPGYRLASQLYDFSGLACEVVLPACLDTLGTGALLALLLHRRTNGVTGRPCAIIGWTALVILVVLNELDRRGIARMYGFAAGDLVFAVLAAAIIARAATGFSGWVRSLLEFKPLIYIGTISYGLYIFHPIVRVAAGRLLSSRGLHLPPGVATGAEMVTTFLVASLSWHFFEKPINDLKRFFPYEPPDAARGMNKTWRVQNI